MADDAEYWGRGSFTPFVLARDGCAVLLVFSFWAAAGDFAFARALFVDVARDHAAGAARARAPGRSCVP